MGRVKDWTGRIEQLIPLPPGWVIAENDNDPVLALALVSFSDPEGIERGRAIRPILNTLDCSGLPDPIYYSAFAMGDGDDGQGLYPTWIGPERYANR